MEEINKLYNLRREFDQGEMNEEKLHKNPMQAFDEWLNYAIEHIEVDATAMVLSTVLDDQVSSRVLLLKETNRHGLVFFSNYNSRKGLELKENNKAAILFFWKELDRQVRIEGIVKRTSAKESDNYFNRRPLESRLSAAVSNQSKIIADRKILDESFKDLRLKTKDQELERPEHWGGYVLIPDYFEFWQGRKNRLHDRICYKKNQKSWVKFRLAP
jgi:pyridoxamine 5'-phosphate oxidase